LNWIAGGDHAPVYTAKSQGWYEDADIDLTIQQGRGADLAPVFNIYASSPYGYY
jgi:NitT/TauT family transport system substrate-binding protein